MAWTNRPPYYHSARPLNPETNILLSRQSDIAPPGITNFQPNSNESLKLPPPPTVATLASIQQLSDCPLGTSKAEGQPSFNSHAIPQFAESPLFPTKAPGPAIENSSNHTAQAVQPTPAPSSIQSQSLTQLKPELDVPLRKNRSSPSSNSLTPSRLYAIKCQIEDLQFQLQNEIRKPDTTTNEFTQDQPLCESSNMGTKEVAGAERSITSLTSSDLKSASISNNADLIKEKIRSLQGELTPENLKVVSWKIANSIKRKERRKRKVKEMQEYRDATEDRRAKLHVEIDKRLKNILTRDRRKERKKIAKQNCNFEKHQRLLERSVENQATMLIQKLQKLKDLRRQRLKREGHFFPEEDEEFFQKILKAEELQSFAETKSKSRRKIEPMHLENSNTVNDDGLVPSTNLDAMLEHSTVGNMKRKLCETGMNDTALERPSSINQTPDMQPKYQKTGHGLTHKTTMADKVQDREESKESYQHSSVLNKDEKDQRISTTWTESCTVQHQPSKFSLIDPGSKEIATKKMDRKLQKNREIWEMYRVLPKLGKREAKRATSITHGLEQPPKTPSNDAWKKFLPSDEFKMLFIS